MKTKAQNRVALRFVVYRLLSESDVFGNHGGELVGVDDALYDFALAVDDEGHGQSAHIVLNQGFVAVGVSVPYGSPG